MLLGLPLICVRLLPQLFVSSRLGSDPEPVVKSEEPLDDRPDSARFAFGSTDEDAGSYWLLLHWCRGS